MYSLLNLSACLVFWHHMKGCGHFWNLQHVQCLKNKNLTKLFFPFMQIQLKAFAIYLFHTYQSNLLEELKALYILDIHSD